MTAGTVVITGGILATVILLCIIAVLCYCRLQVHFASQHEFLKIIYYYTSMPGMGRSCCVTGVLLFFLGFGGYLFLSGQKPD